MKISDVLLRKNAYAQTQEYVSVAYPETSERGGARNMKYKPPGTAAIFFYLFFTGRGGVAWPPWLPPGSATVYDVSTNYRFISV